MWRAGLVDDPLRTLVVVEDGRHYLQEFASFKMRLSTMKYTCNR